jgi:hypothetical protein
MVHCELQKAADEECNVTFKQRRDKTKAIARIQPSSAPPSVRSNVEQKANMKEHRRQRYTSYDGHLLRLNLRKCTYLGSEIFVDDLVVLPSLVSLDLSSTALSMLSFEEGMTYSNLRYDLSIFLCIVVTLSCKQI